MIYAAVGRKAFVSSYCPHSWQRQMADITIDIEIQLSSVKHNGEVHIVHPLQTNLINCDMKVLLLMLTLSFIYPCDIIIFIFKVRVKVPGKYFFIHLLQNPHSVTDVCQCGESHPITGNI